MKEQVLFISKSSQRSHPAPPVQIVVKERENEDVVKTNIRCSENTEKCLWIYGKEKTKFLDFGGFINFKFKILNVLSNPTPLLHSKGLLINQVFDDKLIPIINFTANYSIPLIWVHEHIEPIKWIWSFDLVIVGEYNYAKVWGEICKIIE